MTLDGLPSWMVLEQVGESNWGDEDDCPPAITNYSFYKDSPEGEIILYYDDHAHAYYRYDPDGNRIDIPGVTTVLNIVDKSKALVPWAVKLAIITIREGLTNPDGSFRKLSTEDFNVLLEDARTKHTQHLNEAGDIGHIVHDLLEQAIKKAVAQTNGVVTEIDTSAHTDERVINSAKAALEWITNHKVKFLLTERKVFSREFNVAGTGDGLALVSSCDDPLCCKEVFTDRKDWLDWKTSRNINTGYPAQTAIYAFSYIEETGERVVGRWVIKLNKETGKLEVLYRSPETFETDLNAFLKALELSIAWKALENSIREQKAVQRGLVKIHKDAVKAEVKAEKRATSFSNKLLRMQATKDRNLAKDALYKQLRSTGVSVADAKAEVLVQYPPKPKADDSEDEDEAETTELVQSVQISVEPLPDGVEYIVRL